MLALHEAQPLFIQVLLQKGKRGVREGNVAVFTAFAVTDEERPFPQIEVGHSQIQAFRKAQGQDFASRLFIGSVKR